MTRINKEMLISDIINVDRELVPILMRRGMNCVGCPSARFESLEQAAQAHGMDVDELLDEMNVYLNTRGAVVE